MIERFDHAVIGIPDLEAGMAAFRGLGFAVSEGGRHPSLGTRNAIVRFGLDYLEILTVEDPDLARERGPFGAELLAFLGRSSGLVGYVLAGAALQEQARGLRVLGVGAEGPFDMDRVRPDGRRLEWRLVVPGGSPWRKPWPYLIDWITPKKDLLAWDPAGSHACGVTGVAGVDLVVGNMDEAERLYDRALGLGSRRIRPAPPQTGARSLHYRVGGFDLGIHRPGGEGPMADALEQDGPGPFRLVLSTPAITATARALSRRGVPFTDTPRGLDIDPSAASGARIRIVSA